MPHLPVIDGVVRCTLVWSTVGGVAPRNVIHVRRPAGFPVDLGDLDTSIQSSFQTKQFEAINGAFHGVSIDYLPLDGIDATTSKPSTSANFNGGGTGDWDPLAALCVKFKTGVRGREARGRIFLGPISENSMADGLYDATISADTQTAWEDFRTALNLLGYSQVVASYRHAIAHSVTSYQGRRRISSQRRRLSQLPLR